MAEEGERWQTLEEWLKSGHDLQDMPLPPDGKRMRDLNSSEVRERLLAYHHRRAHQAAEAVTKLRKRSA